MLSVFSTATWCRFPAQSCIPPTIIQASPIRRSVLIHTSAYWGSLSDGRLSVSCLPRKMISVPQFHEICAISVVGDMAW